MALRPLSISAMAYSTTTTTTTSAGGGGGGLAVVASSSTAIYQSGATSDEMSRTRRPTSISFSLRGLGRRLRSLRNRVLSSSKRRQQRQQQQHGRYQVGATRSRQTSTSGGVQRRPADVSPTTTQISTEFVDVPLDDIVSFVDWAASRTSDTRVSV